MFVLLFQNGMYVWETMEFLRKHLGIKWYVRSIAKKERH
jgi:hypothetical protein